MDWLCKRLGFVLHKIHPLGNIYRGVRCLGSDGSRAVLSFGDGNHGALGLPSSAIGYGRDAYEPTRIPALPLDVCSVSAGHYHSLAVTSQGEIWGWGRNEEFQLGRGLHTPRETWGEPRKVEGLVEVKVRSAFASGVMSAAVGDGGSLWVWGKSKRGQLGLGKDVEEAMVPSRVTALASEKIMKVSLGWGHALALAHNGRLFGWGYSSEGRLGQIGQALEPVGDAPLLDSNLDADNSERLVMEAMEKEKDMPIIWEPSFLREEVADVACGLDHSLILCCDGTLLSGGGNEYGQLGRKLCGYGFLPVEVDHSVKSVSAGLGHSFSIGEGGDCLVSWGWNRFHQLGREGMNDFPVFVDALGGKRVVSVSGGRAHSIALTCDGELYTWGCGRNGRLGLGHSADEAQPTVVESLVGVQVLRAASGFDHSLVLVDE